MKRVLSILVLSSFVMATNKPFKVKESYELSYDRNTTSLVRHIKVYKEPKWVAKVDTKSGKSVYFCSPKSMFEFYHRPGKWFDVGVKSENDFAQIVVTDYITTNPIDAKTALYIYGSRATSPAGDDLVAIQGEDRAEKFSKENGGKRILKFDEVSDALIRLLNGRI